ncbi:hypothetical protein M3Y97_00808500 [Aphelenchoides bicaudatus]|nr:hypothetical protein M3Y97_00808500 [Aphelenchoides bicaudatus]
MSSLTGDNTSSNVKQLETLLASASVIAKPPSFTSFALTQLKDGAIELTAGTLGGIANVYAGQPLDTVKVKMQTFPSFYSNWINCMYQTFKLDGVRGLYAGSVPALVVNIAETAVVFTAYDYCQKVIAHFSNKHVNDMSSLQNACAGSLAASFAALILCPTELVKCRLQAQREMNPNIRSTPFKVCRHIFKTEGFSTFGKGMTPTMIRDVFGYFFFFGAYEMSRDLLAKKGQSKDNIGLLGTAIAGSIGGVALWAAIYPVDLIKSRMQIKGGTAMQVARSVLKMQGFVSLYRGLTPTLIGAALSTPFLVIAYEETKKFLHRVL